MVLSGVPRKKSPVTPPVIDPGTSRLVAQCLNHHATPGPIGYKEGEKLYSCIFQSLTFADYVIKNTKIMDQISFASGRRLRHKWTNRQQCCQLNRPKIKTAGSFVKYFPVFRRIVLPSSSGLNSPRSVNRHSNCLNLRVQTNSLYLTEFKHGGNYTYHLLSYFISVFCAHSVLMCSV